MDLLKNFFKGDKAIWIIYLFLCLISIVEVFSASSTLTYKSGDHWGPITNHLTLLMVVPSLYGLCIIFPVAGLRLLSLYYLYHGHY